MEKKKYQAINPFSLGNMDETSAFFKMIETKIVMFKGTKSAIIKTQNKEKCLWKKKEENLKMNL